MRVIIRRQVVKRCPYRDELDVGGLVISVDGDAPELHALGVQVDAIVSEPVSHEDFTRSVAALLPPGSRVVTTWRTGPWSVEVREGDAILRHPVVPVNP